MDSLFDPPFNVGDRIVSTCGSMYRGCEGVITKVEEWTLIGEFTDADGLHYSVTLSSRGGREIQGGFCTSQMVLASQDPGREHDKPCEGCCCLLGGHREVGRW